jgi:hypothetical protein
MTTFRKTTTIGVGGVLTLVGLWLACGLVLLLVRENQWFLLGGITWCLAVVAVTTWWCDYAVENGVLPRLTLTLGFVVLTVCVGGFALVLFHLYAAVLFVVLLCTVLLWSGGSLLNSNLEV